jgi:two-component system chemotaxis response regulator CheB
MPGHDIIVIGGSAGGVEALKELTRELPSDLPAAVFAVLRAERHAAVIREVLRNNEKAQVSE